MMTAEQLRAARAILRLEQKTLAERAGISVETIKRLERQNGLLQAKFDTIRRLREALELAGAGFAGGGKDIGPSVGPAIDRLTALIEQFNHHFATTWNLAKEIQELTRNDPQLQVSKPQISLIESIASNYRLKRSYQWRGRSKGGAREKP
jgi:transcriptional regulator with XRE-family HTH domain